MKRYTFDVDGLQEELYDLRHVKRVTSERAKKTGEPVYITVDRGPGTNMDWYIMQSDGTLMCDGRGISFNN